MPVSAPEVKVFHHQKTYLEREVVNEGVQKVDFSLKFTPLPVIVKVTARGKIFQRREK